MRVDRDKGNGVFPAKRGGNEFRPIDEVNYRALRLIVERAEGGGLAKKREMEKIDAAYKNGTLVLPSTETEDQRWWRCEARFMLGDYSDWGGWQYRDKWAAGVWFRNPFKCDIWRGPQGKAETVYLVGEQGIGDEVLFASVIPDLCRDVDAVEGGNGRVIVELQSKMIEPVVRSMRAHGLRVEGRAALLTPDEARGEGFIRIAQEPEEVGATAWVTMGELCRVYRTRMDKFPRTPWLRERPEMGPNEAYRGRVCVSWRGAQGAIPLEALLRMYPNALSVQYDQAWDEEVERPKIDLKDDINGVMEVLAGADKLVTVSTSVAHIAAAMGVRTDLILAEKGTGRRGSLFPWKWWSDARSKDGVRCTSQWYGDHVQVYRNWRAYETEIRNESRRNRHAERTQGNRDEARKAA